MVAHPPRGRRGHASGVRWRSSEMHAATAALSPRAACAQRSESAACRKSACRLCRIGNDLFAPGHAIRGARRETPRTRTDRGLQMLAQPALQGRDCRRRWRSRWSNLLVEPPRGHGNRTPRGAIATFTRPPALRTSRATLWLALRRPWPRMQERRDPDPRAARFGARAGSRRGPLGRRSSAW